MPVEALTAVNGDVELHGTLVTPPGEGVHPVVLAIHESRQGLRDAPLHRHLQELLPQEGIAVLSYDRRGEGDSGGEAQGATLTDKAADAVAWIDRLREHPQLDPERIALWGHSQGGWIAPLAAVEREGIAAMVCVSPSAVTPAAQMTYACEHQIRERGFSEEDARRGGELHRLVDRYWRGDGVSQEEAVAAIEAAKAEPWFPIVPPLDPRNPAADAWRAELDFDVEPLLAQLAMPILVVFGETDRWVPIDASADVWRRAIPREEDLTVAAIAGTGHSPTFAEDPLDPHEAGPVAPEYERLLVEWLRARLHQSDRKASMPAEELTVVNDGVELHGTLTTPEGEGPHPAILAFQAANEGTREARLMRHLEEVLPANGIAVLTFDRRGLGASTGDANLATFEDKASDGRAWFELLRQHPAIDPERVGIYGHSQGGWIGPMTAAGRDDVALMAFYAACAVTPGEQMQFGYGYQIREAGFSEEDVQRGIELRKLVDRYWRGDGVSREEAIAAIDAAKSEPWFGIAPPVDPRREGAETWREEMDLDIVPTIEQLPPMPILLMFGLRDRWVPSEESEARWRAAVPEGTELTVETIPNTSHFPTPDHEGKGPLAPRYEELLVSWLREHFGVGAEGAR